MSNFDPELADAVLAAVEQEEKTTSANIKIDRYSFLRGFYWGMEFKEYCRYFKAKYWRDNILANAKQNAPSK